MKTSFGSFSPNAWVRIPLVAAMLAVCFSGPSVSAQQIPQIAGTIPFIDPEGCLGSGLGIVLLARTPRGASAAIGQVGGQVIYDARVFNTDDACVASGVSVTVTRPDKMVFSSSLSEFYKFAVEGMQYTAPDGSRMSIAPSSADYSRFVGRNALRPGESILFRNVQPEGNLQTPSNSYRIRAVDLQTDQNTQIKFVAAEADTAGMIHQNNPLSRGSASQGVKTVVPEPSIAVAIRCANLAGDPETIQYIITVTNNGTVAHTTSAVSLNIDGANVPVPSVPSLAVGQSFELPPVEVRPTDPCAAPTARTTATGTYVINRIVNGVTIPESVTFRNADGTVQAPPTAETSACSVPVNPLLTLAVDCTNDPVMPGHPLRYEGTVTNGGNVTLENVNVLTSPSRGNVVFAGQAPGATPDLAPGTTLGFTLIYVVPEGTENCVLPTEFTAAGNNRCNGSRVQATAQTECDLEFMPSLKVTLACPPEPTAQGRNLNYTGTVVNTGNITLRDIEVVAARPTAGTRVTTIRSLAPGATADFSGRFSVPSDCCNIDNMVVATGTSDCTNTVVTDTATSVCPVLFTPALELTKVCPPDAVSPGEVLTYEGTIRNSGNITLRDVIVFSDVLGDGAPFLGPIALSPGEELDYIGSFVVPSGFCGPEVVTARARSLCGDVPVTVTNDTACSVEVTPRWTLTNVCPATPIVLGAPATFTGTLTNTGDVDITGVTISNSFGLIDGDPIGQSDVTTRAVIAPGETVTFPFTITVPADRSCCEVIDRLTATGTNPCTGDTLTTTSTAVCPLVTSPAIDVVLDCVSGTFAVGDWVIYKGRVSNVGDVILEDVAVSITTGPANTELSFIGSSVLGVGETEEFVVSYEKTAAGPLAPLLVTAVGEGSCDRAPVTDAASCNIVGGPAIPSIAAFSASVSEVEIIWNVSPAMPYQLQFCGSLGGSWEPNGDVVIADGATFRLTQPLENGQIGFYRLIPVQ